MKRDRLNSVLTDAAALGGYASCADVRVEVSITTVSVYAVTTTAPTSRIPIISGSRSVEVLGPMPVGGKSLVHVTIEGAIANALRSMAARRRHEKEDAVETARRALARAEEDAARALETERRLVAILEEDISASGVSGTPLVQVAT
jgi:hypothetical protein